MMLPLFRAPLGAVVLSGALALATGSARAQGTDAQREACTPDALKLCQATIPDVDKTTACMKAHFAQLSPRCKVAFNEVAGSPASPEPRREAVTPPPARDEETGFGITVPGVDNYAAQIRAYCRDGLIDPYTCRNTLAALRGAE